MPKGRTVIPRGSKLSEQHKQRIAAGQRAAHARRAAMQANFALQILAALKTADQEKKL